MERQLESLSELELDVLGALWQLGAAADGPEISRAIKRTFGRSAAIGRVYVAFGTLAERRLIDLCVRTTRTGGRNRCRSNATLTWSGSRAAREWNGRSSF